MFSLRPACRVLSRRVVNRSNAWQSHALSFSTVGEPEEDTAIMVREKAKLDAEDKVDSEKSPAQREMEKMTKMDPDMVFGTTVAEPDPIMPDNPAEIAALDPAAYRDITGPDGSKRVVHIRQNQSRVTQGPESSEKTWVISFMDEGETSQTWDNALMGWVSGADPYASTIQTQLTFENASNAVYFAKKRGWNYVVDHPIYRDYRDDEAQYQDNFLPQSVTTDLHREKTQCKQWSRTKSGASHYFRPLKYHGDGVVPQHGPNAEETTKPHVEGYYKMR